MLKLNNRSLVPPPDTAGRHFRYRHAETGHVSEARDWYSWMTACKAHRRANGLPIPADFAATAEEQLCEQLPPEWCEQEREGASRVDLGFSLSDVTDWIKAVATRFFTAQPMVSQEEANRRARICVACPFNIDAGGCGGCGKVAGFLTPGMSSKSTPYDASLKNCAVCRCYLRVMAWFPVEVLEANETPEKQALFPSYCWRLKISPAYRPSEELVTA